MSPHSRAASQARRGSFLGVSRHDHMRLSHPIRGLICGVAIGTIFGGLWFAYSYSDIDNALLLPGDYRSKIVLEDLTTSLLIFIFTGVPVGLIAALKQSVKDTHDS